MRTDSKSYNRTTGGGGSDTEAITTRPLLYPDEIKEAVKPKGESIQYDGSCIVWVGYERPFYMYKFDTLNHPLISLVGGPKGTPQFKTTLISGRFTVRISRRKGKAFRGSCTTAECFRPGGTNA